ncbi:Various environmental stresses-induced protein [Aminobacter sp. MSH1]|uniref:HutD/Ves family protein n=1 Tax=Aminobacter sp. MSH1 TaxID=374606 RepID=UPI000D357CF4|nr:HutD family protein [Aminobacter sp. MSH1]AWC24585.1 Various environmental stresses-induced protein [Aminobacter sp. MSH1]
MRIIRHADCRSMPWKNGGGVTTEIMAWPPAAGLDDFDWRISMAQVASGGPFSVFAGIDRTLTVLAGSMELAAGDAAPVALSPRSEPYIFPGDVSTEAKFIDGPVLDFNVMTRRGRISHSVQRLEISEPTRIGVGEGTSLVFFASGSARIGNEKIAALDTLHIEAGPVVLEIEPSEAVSLLLVSIRRQ